MRDYSKKARTTSRVRGGELRCRVLAGLVLVLLFALPILTAGADAQGGANQASAPGPGGLRAAIASEARKQPDSPKPRPAPVEKLELATPEKVDWPTVVARLSRKMNRGVAVQKEADALFSEISAALREDQARVEDALKRRSPRALAHRAELHRVYAARVRLLDLVSPELRSRVLGAGPLGRRESRLELEIARLDLFFQTLAIPQGLRSIVSAFFDDPLVFLSRFAEMIFALLVFRFWRQWAKKGLPRARISVLSIRPRTDLHLRLARMLWYVQRLRGPVEWLALLYVASVKLDPGDLGELATLIGVVLFWVLLTRLGILVIDALGVGRDGRVEDRVRAIRRRSLRLGATWFLLTSLGLDLISRYVGEAALHAWASRLVTLLTLPLALTLIVWWQDEIRRRLEAASEDSEIARRLLKHQYGLLQYPMTAVSAVYLASARILRSLLRAASRFEIGRRWLAALLRREVEREHAESVTSGDLISEELERALLTPDETQVVGPYRDGLERLLAHVEKGRGGTIVILAERGGGIRSFLERARESIGPGMQIIRCPVEGVSSLQRVIRDEFALAEGADLEQELPACVEARGVKVIAFQDLHRIVRPCVGGLDGLERIAQVVGSLGDDVLCLVTLTHEAWTYVSRMLGDRAILHEVIELPAWSEDQIEKLIDGRCRQAGIEPDYRGLSFPRQYDENERATLLERNRSGYRRVLWELSSGNPEVAIRLFAKSLRVQRGGRVVVRLPQPASSTEMAAANLTTLLVLKVLMQTGVATIEDLRKSIRERTEVLQGVLTACLQNGWIEEEDERYEIAWSAYRRVKAVLIRRGLIIR